MDATTRPNLVAVSLPLEVVVPRISNDRAVSMLTQWKPRARTSGPSEDVQIFDYIPRAGEDGQFKLFNYRHLASEIPSETPRTLPDVVYDEEHEFENYTFSFKPFPSLETLILEPSNEEQEFKNHKRPSKALPAMSCMEQTNVSVLSNGNSSDQDRTTGPENHLLGSTGSGKVLRDLPSYDIITANPKLLAAGSGLLFPSRNQHGNDENYSPHPGDLCDTMYDFSSEQYIMEVLPRSFRKHEENRQEYNVFRLRLDGSLARIETPETQPTSVYAPREQVFAEKPWNPKSKSNSSISIEHKGNIEEVQSESGSRSFILRDTAGKQTSVHPILSPGHTVVKKSASYKLEAESPRHETHKSRSFSNPCRAEKLSSETKSGEFRVESFIPALDGLHISSFVGTQASISANKAVATKVKSEAKTAGSVTFDLASHSLFGIGSWIENYPSDLLSLDVEGPFDVCLLKTDFGVLEDYFAPGWQAAFRTCPENSTSDSGSQGANYFEAGSHGSRRFPPNSGSRHRKHPSDGGDGPGEEDDPFQSKKAKTENEINRRFACPFYIHDPTYFRTSSEHGQKYTLCAAGKGYADIARVKEHIRRVHSPEIVCARCGSTFEDQQALSKHLRHEERPECPVLDVPTPRSMTSDMMAELSKRGKRETNLSEEDKWYKIYELLFPDDARPSNGAYQHDYYQPPTPSQEKQIPVQKCEEVLPRLLERRLETTFGEVLPDQELRELLKNMVISELEICIKQLSVEPSETMNTSGGSDMLRHKQSGESSTDSGYGSGCGNIECMGDCGVCEQMFSHVSHQPGEFIQSMSSPVFDPTDQYLNPSLFTNAELNGNLLSTENMDELLDHHFPSSYGGDLYPDGYDA